MYIIFTQSEKDLIMLDGLGKINGGFIKKENGKLVVPDNPVIAYIEGDGIGIDITPAMKHVVNKAVEKAYGGKKSIAWYEIFAGEKAFSKFGEYLPKETIEVIKKVKVAIKGPLTTPVGGGFRSVNVALRQILDLYACIRPVRYYKGIPSPMKHPEKMNVVIFRENTEDVYAGIEWKAYSSEAKKLIEYFKKEFNVDIKEGSGIGIKPISESGSKRLVRMALDYAVQNKRKSVTFMHKGNIQKFTEGAFKEWGYEVAKKEFGSHIAFEGEFDGDAPLGKIVVNDRIADNMFQQILTRTDEYDVVATTNLNGDYFSDACAAQSGGLGMAPGANIGEDEAVFEATHGTAPKYAGMDKANPGSLILSAKMMLDYIGWQEAGSLLEKSVERTIEQKKVTYDLERQMEGAEKLSASEFAEAVSKNM